MSGTERSASSEQGDVIPGGVLLVSLVVGGYVVWNRPFEGRTSYIWWIILAGCTLAVLYVIWGVSEVYREEGFTAAVAWLLHQGDSDSASSPSNASTEKTPPVPEDLKNELYVERANRRCEWCDDRVDSPDVHHIEPRSECGPNTPTNLIVLCPNCHRKADRGRISRSKLSYRVAERMVEAEV